MRRVVREKGEGERKAVTDSTSGFQLQIPSLHALVFLLPQRRVCLYLPAHT